MTQILTYLCAGNKRPVRGAMQRLAKFTRIPFWKVQRFVYAVDTPDERQAQKIQEFITSKRRLFANKPGPKAKKKQTVPKKLSGRFS